MKGNELEIKNREKRIFDYEIQNNFLGCGKASELK